MFQLRTLTLAVLLAAPAAQAQVKAQPGEYAYSVKVQLMGMTMPAVKFNQCVSQQDLDDGKAYVNTEKQADCSHAELKWSGESFTVAGSCSNPERTMSGKGTASDTGFDLVMEVKVGGGMPMQQKQTVSARRVGDCAK